MQTKTLTTPNRKRFFVSLFTLLSKKFIHSKLKKSWNNLFLITWFFRKITWLKLFTFMILNENKSPLHTESIFINEITRQQNTIKSVESEFQNREILYQSREILKIRFCCFECFLMLSEKRNKNKNSPLNANFSKSYHRNILPYLFFVLWHLFLDNVSP